jgi:hypothetical protein
VNGWFPSSFVSELKKGFASFIFGLCPALGLWPYLLFHKESLVIGLWRLLFAAGEELVGVFQHLADYANWG